MVGIAVGALSAVLGVGGGILTVPVLTVGFGADMHTAVGTSLLVVVPTSIAAIRSHRSHGNIAPGTAKWIAGAALPGAAIGAGVALALPDATLARTFSVIAVLIAAREIVTVVRSAKPSGKDLDSLLERADALDHK
ncbi:sulfite exporter TauE/SafE family protein [Rhodococcus koreensis]